jgi:hypothetical protein
MEAAALAGMGATAGRVGAIFWRFSCPRSDRRRASGRPAAQPAQTADGPDEAWAPPWRFVP